MEKREKFSIVIKVLFACLLCVAPAMSQTMISAIRTLSSDRAAPGDTLVVTVTPESSDSPFYAVYEDIKGLLFTGEYTADSNFPTTIDSLTFTIDRLNFTKIGSAPFFYKIRIPDDSQPGKVFTISGKFWSDPKNKVAIKPPSTEITVIPGITEVTTEVPKSFKVLPPYPNPFNLSTTLMVDIPKESHLQMNIYNIYGQRVSIIIDEKVKAGRYSFLWNARGMSSGLYFCKTQNESKKYITKLILIK